VSAQAARSATREACRLIRLNVARTYVEAARAWRDVRDVMRAECSCRKCKLLRGSGKQVRS